MQQRSEQGELTLSLDEMTGIQALERTMPDIAMKPGRIAKREFEYQCNGTQNLIASFNVATGAIDHATVGSTRAEADLATIRSISTPHPDSPLKTAIVQSPTNP